MKRKKKCWSEIFYVVFFYVRVELKLNKIKMEEWNEKNNIQSFSVLVFRNFHIYCNFFIIIFCQTKLLNNAGNLEIKFTKSLVLFGVLLQFFFWEGHKLVNISKAKSGVDVGTE